MGTQLPDRKNGRGGIPRGPTDKMKGRGGIGGGEGKENTEVRRGKGGGQKGKENLNKREGIKGGGDAGMQKTCGRGGKSGGLNGWVVGLDIVWVGCGEGQADHSMAAELGVCDDAGGGAAGWT